MCGVWEDARAVRPYKQDTTPKVVAIAVSTVIRIWRIFPQRFDLKFSIGFKSLKFRVRDER